MRTTMYAHMFLQMLARCAFAGRRFLSTTTTRSVSPVHFPQLLDVRRYFAVSSQPDLSQEVREPSLNLLPYHAFWLINWFLVR